MMAGKEEGPSISGDLGNAVTQATTPKSKFAVLKALIESVEISDRDILDTVFNLLVGDVFDLEVNFIIQDEECIIYMLDILTVCSVKCQAEIWSKFKGICRKSYRNLQACVEVGLVQKLLNTLPNADEMISEILIDMLSLLASYNITVKELKRLLSMLKGENGKWPPYAVKLLGVLQATTERQGPDCFFSFPGKENAAIALPPLKTWPYANGFTFTTWFRLDPLNSLRADMDKPYLYCFRSSKGMGYSGHFVGNCFIVTVLKSKGKGFQHCLKFEFKPRKWYMVSIVHIYNRWRVSEVKCYANGQLVSSCEMNWNIGGYDQYDKCFLGSAETGDASRVFCGQMTASYVFSEAFSASQVYALYQLGPAYKNQFKFPTESDHLLANHPRKVLYEDSKLSDAIVLAYNPKSTDSQLCLECSPRSNNRNGSSDGQRWFVHSPHALMLQGVKAIVTHSIHSALHSVGGAEVLFPLFAQLDYKQGDGSVETTVCSTLLNFLLQLLQGSVKTQQQVLQGKGFLVIGTLLERANKEHISMDVLDALIAMAKFLDQLPNAMPLMRQFCDHILFNPALWIHTKTKVQICLYTFLATEFVASPTIQTSLRRVSTVLFLVHALKHYYWVVNPQPRSGIIPKGLGGPRPTTDEILSLRAFILLFLKQLVTRNANIMEDELQALLGYLLTIHEDENLLDILQLLVAMLSEHGSTVAPVLDQLNGLTVVFKLLGSRSELVRIHSLKLLAYFLKQLSEKRKGEIMDSHSLFMLVGERLLLYPDQITVSTYNALYELMVEDPCVQVLHKPHPEPVPTTFIKNPAMMKVTATMLRQCHPELVFNVKIMFLTDLLNLFQVNRENRRTLLQQSVWQDWMLALGYLRPKTAAEEKCQELVYQLFRVLLYHAIKLEWGGWRVWVDTLAIVHSKVSYEEHKTYLERMYEEYKESERRSKERGQVSAITGMKQATPLDRATDEVGADSADELATDADATKAEPKIEISEVQDGDNDGLVVVITNADEAVDATTETQDVDVEETLSEPINQEEKSETRSLRAGEVQSGDHQEKAMSGPVIAKEEAGKAEKDEEIEEIREDKAETSEKRKEKTASKTKEGAEDDEEKSDGDDVGRTVEGEVGKQEKETEDEKEHDVDEKERNDAEQEVKESEKDGETIVDQETADSQEQIMETSSGIMKVEDVVDSDEIKEEASGKEDTVAEKDAEQTHDVVQDGEESVHTQEKEEDAQKKEEDAQEQEEDAQEKEEDAQELEEDAQEQEEDAQEKEDAQKKEEDAQEKEEDAQEKEEDAQEQEEDALEKKETAQKKEEDAQESGTSSSVADKDVEQLESNENKENLEETDDQEAPNKEESMTPKDTEDEAGSIEQKDDTHEKEADEFNVVQEEDADSTVARNGEESKIAESEKTDQVPPPSTQDPTASDPQDDQPADEEETESTEEDPVVKVQKAHSSHNQRNFSPGPRTVVFRVPEFKWSDIHLRLLDDLFVCLENDIESWKRSGKQLSEVVNHNDNVIFLHNTIHLVSQMVDNVILACGGILPILASATSPNYELDNIESSQGLSMDSAWTILNRLCNFIDVLVLTSTINLVDVEGDKNMQNGGILRQCLRTACMCAVRNCLESRYLRRGASVPSTPNCLNHPSDGVDVEKSLEKLSESDSMDVLAVEAAQILISLMSNQATPRLDPIRLLQDADVYRLRGAIYRDIDDAKQAQFLALAVVYFVSVLMVSKYRDILDPESLSKLQEATIAKRITPRKKKIYVGARFPAKVKVHTEAQSDVVSTQSMTNGHSSPDAASQENAANSGDVKGTDQSIDGADEGKSTSTNVQDILRNLTKRAGNDASTLERISPSSFPIQVTSIQSSYHSFDRSVVVQSKPSENTAEESTVVDASKDEPSSSDQASVEDKEAIVISNGGADHSDLPQFDPSSVNILESDEGNVSHRLERSLDQLAPLLRDVFLDFSSYLSKTLVGSHGQELLVEGLVCMKSYTSVVELVMLLCSQEWQNSIQKNAGLAFIELINEGRLQCHGMKDHVVKVANEADFILNKQRAEDVKKHAQFESMSAVHLAQQRDEERQCDALITAAKHRDHAAAQALKNRITNILTNKLGAWGSAFDSRANEYWMLDSWEDDTRRRRRFVRNPYGSSHKEATLISSKESSLVLDAASPGAIPKSPTTYKVKGADKLSTTEEEVEEEVDMEKLQGPVSFSTEADLITPGACLRGVFSITPDEFFFEVNEQHPSYTKLNHKILAYTDGMHGKWLFQEVRGVFTRRYLLQNTAVEVFLANRNCIMFNFSDVETVRKVVAHLPAVGIGTGYGLPQSRRVSMLNPRQLFKSSNMTERWQKREISNFEYLMFLNTIAGRTFNDLNQYPVFPWVLSNYDVEELDLSLPSNYRDLSKPVGALNPKRAAYFQSRYESWDDPSIPKFHFGTHYSNAAFTLGWLVRVEPFTTHFLALQGGRFDHSDRTFHSMLQSWKNCQRDTHDVKELIPEFFYLPEMFVNSNNYNLGVTSDGLKVNDVILPPWAKSADDFVLMNRMALESEIVSCQIHQWIDLIFGFKQRGPEAMRAINVFYHLTYENSIDIDQIKDPVEKMGIQEQIRNFGQTPSQLLVAPHPPRSSAMHVTPMMFKETENQEVVMVLKFQSNSPVVHVAANTHPSLHTPAVVTCTKNLQFCINKWQDPPETKSSTSSGAEDTPPSLPITPDPLMGPGGVGFKRQIQDMLDQSVQVQSSCFVVTADNRYLVTCGYWDRSIRIITMETGKLNQVVFGHWDVVTCLTRSETYIGGDCYFVSGSRDTTLMLWYWNGRKNLVIGDSSSADENPSPRAVLTGHDTEITCAAVCAELGLIASGSMEGPILLHTITGDLLRSLEPDDLDKDSPLPRPELIVFTGEGMIIVSYTEGFLCNFTMNGRSLKRKTVQDKIRAMLTSNNSQFLVTGGDAGIMEVWNAWDFKHLYAYPQCDAGIRSLSLSHDQKVVITGMTSGSIVAFRINFNKWHYEYQDKK